MIRLSPSLLMMTIPATVPGAPTVQSALDLYYLANEEGALTDAYNGRIHAIAGEFQALLAGGAGREVKRIANAFLVSRRPAFATMEDVTEIADGLASLETEDVTPFYTALRIIESDSREPEIADAAISACREFDEKFEMLKLAFTRQPAARLLAELNSALEKGHMMDMELFVESAVARLKGLKPDPSDDEPAKIIRDIYLHENPSVRYMALAYTRRIEKNFEPVGRKLWELQRTTLLTDEARGKPRDVMSALDALGIFVEHVPDARPVARDVFSRHINDENPLIMRGARYYLERMRSEENGALMSAFEDAYRRDGWRDAVLSVFFGMGFGKSERDGQTAAVLVGNKPDNDTN